MNFELDRLANQLDWNLLRTFMVIVQERSITGAAQRLHVTQPSVSAALRRLEERLEIQLVERGSGRAFTITKAGEAVYREALEIYGGVIRLNRLRVQTAQALSGNIVVYWSSHLDLQFLHPVMAAFQALHPAVTFSQVAAQCADVVRAVEQRVASFGFCTRVDTSPRFRKTALPTQTFGYFCGPAHPLFQVLVPGSADIARSNVVAFEGETLAGPLSQIARHRARNDIGDKLMASTTSSVDLINMIRAGPAIACLSVGQAGLFGADLWHIPLQGQPPLVDAFLITDTERHLTPAERSFEVALAETLNGDRGEETV